jgi:quercetin dioxygenase-like cupin family protein
MGDAMRVTTFTEHDGTVEPAIDDAPTWQPFEEYDGESLDGVELVELGQTAGAELQLVRIAAGGHFAMHSSSDTAFCQIVEGAGTLRLPDGRELTYRGPELYVFHPHTLHEWCAVTSDTLLSVCLLRHSGNE